MEFVAEIVSALAWPVALLVVVLILRRPIIELLGREGLKRLKAGPVEAEWERQLGRVEDELRQLPRDSDGVSIPSPLARVSSVFTDELVELATSDPIAAISGAYDAIGAAIEAVLELAGVEVATRAEVLELARLAHEHGLLSEKTLRAVEGAVVLRNLAMSRPAGTEARRALEYLPLVDAIVYSLTHDAAVTLSGDDWRGLRDGVDSLLS